MPRLTTFAVAVPRSLSRPVSAALRSRRRAVQDLGNGIHAAIGVAVGTGGGAERGALPSRATPSSW